MQGAQSNRGVQNIPQNLVLLDQRTHWFYFQKNNVDDRVITDFFLINVVLQMQEEQF